MTERTTQKLMLLDACVLIDYWKTEKSILQSFSTHLGGLYVVSTVLEDEVDDINDPNELINLGVNIITPELLDLLTAGAGKGPLSFYDHLCILVAKREGFTCVTNDKPLRNACETAGVDVIWGLEPMLMLYDQGEVTESDALKVASEIRESNPMYITQKVINTFRAKLKAIQRSKSGTTNTGD